MNPGFNDIVKNLGSVDELVRCGAIEDLQTIDKPEVIPLLISALQDKSVRVRETAIDVLVKVGGPAVAEATAALLCSEDVPLRNAAMETLEKLGQASLDALEKYIDSLSVDIRKFSIDTIGKVVSKETKPNSRVFESLVTRLSDESVNVAGAAAEALGLMKDDKAIPFLLEHLSGPNQSSWLQCNIIVALSRISSTSSLLAIKDVDSTQLSIDAKAFLEMALNGEVT